MNHRAPIRRSRITDRGIELALMALFALVVCLAVVALVLSAIATPAAAGGNHGDICDRKPWKPECQTTTTLPPETTTTTAPSTTTTEVPPTTLPPPDTPTIVWVDATYRQECPTPERPAGLLEVTVTGTAGTVVDVMGQTVTIPGTATFDLPAQGFVWTLYADWDGGSVTLTDLAPVCDDDPPAPIDPPVDVDESTPPPTLPVTGPSPAVQGAIDIALVAGTLGAVLLFIEYLDRRARRRRAPH